MEETAEVHDDDKTLALVEALLAKRKKNKTDDPNANVKLSAIEKEIIVFEEKPTVEVSVGRQGWWRNRKEEFPLFKCAQDVPSVLSSSSESERVFSSEGLV